MIKEYIKRLIAFWKLRRELKRVKLILIITLLFTSCCAVQPMPVTIPAVDKADPNYIAHANYIEKKYSAVVIQVGCNSCH